MADQGMADQEKPKDEPKKEETKEEVKFDPEVEEIVNSTRDIRVGDRVTGYTIRPAFNPEDIW